MTDDIRDYITPDRIANKIRLMRDEHSGSVLIAEGDTDARVWKNLVDRTKCYVENASNKDLAIKALDILEKDNFAGVLAIVDADFWRLEETLPTSQNLLLTDTHDLETMLIQSPALEKVLSEHGSEEKIKRMTETCGKDVRSLLIEGGLPVGYLRWVSWKDKLELRFENLSFKKFIDDKNLILDKLKLIKSVKDNSQKQALDDRDIQNRIDSLKNDAHDVWYVCCGHDLIGILSIGLCKALGTCNSKQVEPTILEKDLRLAYDFAYFRQTKLFQAIQDWEKANQPFKVLSTLETDRSTHLIT